jgi:hypothetical protein
VSSFRDKVVGVFVRFSCATSSTAHDIKSPVNNYAVF